MQLTRLLIELETGAAPSEIDQSASAADGLVINAVSGVPPVLQHADERFSWALRAVDPATAGDWRECPGTQWVGEGRLDTVARRRERWPELSWVLRADIRRPSVSYRFVASAPGAGFSVYQPDLSALRGYRVNDGGEMELAAWMRNAVELGFDTIWLHAPEAAAFGRGLDLELLERARQYGGARCRLWLSGGVSEPQHLANLAVYGGASAVIIDSATAARCGCDALLSALRQAEATAGPALARASRATGP